MRTFSKYILIIFLTFSFVECDRQKTINDNTKIEVNISESNETDQNIFIENESKEIMYVSSIEGLNLRAQPLSQSERKSVLPHGLRIIVSKTQTEETINGITSFWYKTSGRFGSGYVFGAYLSKKNTGGCYANFRFMEY